MRRTSSLFFTHPNNPRIAERTRNAHFQWLPRRLLLVRHGESAANVDREVYSNTPDWRISLTARGREQAFDCGKRLRKIIGNEKLYIYYSPYRRTQQTLEEIRKSLDVAHIQGEREDERLREQEIGNYQPLDHMDATWAQRNQFSRLYYRFPFGESSADVGDRVSSFFDSLLRERAGVSIPNLKDGREQAYTPDAVSRWLELRDRWRDVAERQDDGVSEANNGLGRAGDGGVLPPNDSGGGINNDQNVLIVAHGLLLRLFVGRWFRVPMEVFETMMNPPNCAIVVLERDDKLGRLVMSDISKQLFGSDPLLQAMKFDGVEDTEWYREQFLGIIDPDRDAQQRPDEDDDENHYSHSAAHNSLVGAPAPPQNCVRPRQEAAVSPLEADPRSLGNILHGSEGDDALLKPWREGGIWQ